MTSATKAIGYAGAAKTLFTWVGGKNRLARALLEETQKIKHSNYIEVFGGSAALLMNKPPALLEVYNDINKTLVNLLRVARDPAKSKELERLAEAIPASLVIFQELRELVLAWMNDNEESFKALKAAQRLDNVDDETAAAYAFFYVQNCGYAGTFLGSSFGRRKKSAENRAHSLGVHFPALEVARERLRRVLIECLDWREIVEYYDAPETLFFIDPPYDSKTSKQYRTGWNAADSEKLVDRLLTLKASALVTCYDSENFQRLERAGWERKTFELFRVIDSKKDCARKRATETLYIKNNDARNTDALFN